MLERINELSEKIIFQTAIAADLAEFHQLLIKWHLSVSCNVFGQKIAVNETLAMHQVV